MTPDAPLRPQWYRRVLRTLGIDRAIGYTVLMQAFALVSRPLLLGLMVAYLSVEEQGYQYTILALIGLRTLFEMGVGIALVHFVGRESARLTLSPELGVSGDGVAFARVASLFQMIVVGYAVIAAVFVVSLLPGGWAFLRASEGSDAIAWETTWVVAVVATALSFPANGIGSLLIGGGEFVPILRMRLLATVIQAALYGGMLLAGTGLLAASVSTLAGTLLQMALMGRRYRIVFRDLWNHRPGANGVSWWREVFPFQWRVAVSWLSNYFLSQVMVPIAFRFFGQAAAGRLGLTLAVAGILQGFAYGWVATKIPRYAAMLGGGDRQGLRESFRRDLRYAVAVYLLGAACGILGLLIAPLWWPGLSERVLSLESLAAILLMGLTALVVECLGSCLNAFHRDPLMPIRLSTALLTTGAAILVAEVDDLRTMVFAVCGVSTASAAVSCAIWRRCMDRWPAPAAAEGEPQP